CVAEDVEARVDGHIARKGHHIERIHDGQKGLQTTEPNGGLAVVLGQVHDRDSRRLRSSSCRSRNGDEREHRAVGDLGATEGRNDEVKKLGLRVGSVEGRGLEWI
ncbi:hypothetical protein PENTCL1PPCAC_17163, partial [Pristionchus entomophagus]